MPAAIMTPESDTATAEVPQASPPTVPAQSEAREPEPAAAPAAPVVAAAPTDAPAVAAAPAVFCCWASWLVYCSASPKVPENARLNAAAELPAASRFVLID